MDVNTVPKLRSQSNFELADRLEVISSEMFFLSSAAEYLGREASPRAATGLCFMLRRIEDEITVISEEMRKDDKYPFRKI